MQSQARSLLEMCGDEVIEHAIKHRYESEAFTPWVKDMLRRIEPGNGGGDVYKAARGCPHVSHSLRSSAGEDLSLSGPDLGPKGLFVSLHAKLTRS